MFNRNEKIALTVILFLFLAIYFIESKKPVNSEFVNKIQNIAPFAIFMGITIYNIWITGKLNVQSLHLNNHIFVTWILICITMTVYVLYKKQVLPNENDNERLKESVRKAFIALIIAFFARLDQVIAPFFLVFVFSYFSQVDWT